MTHVLNRRKFCIDTQHWDGIWYVVGELCHQDGTGVYVSRGLNAASRFGGDGPTKDAAVIELAYALTMGGVQPDEIEVTDNTSALLRQWVKDPVHPALHPAYYEALRGPRLFELKSVAHYGNDWHCIGWVTHGEILETRAVVDKYDAMWYMAKLLARRGIEVL